MEKRYNARETRWHYYDDSLGMVLKFLDEATQLADNGKHPGIKIEEVKTLLNQFNSSDPMG
ncbi:hypothetical protein [Pantoea dispersa]|uniref:hypothetical protein n=1 Tax=Pantoea dispersa TaxID=59814 RepID=UPI0039B64B78